MQPIINRKLSARLHKCSVSCRFIMENIIHLDKNKEGQKKVELNIIVDQTLLDDIVKVLHWIEGYNQSAHTKCDAGFHLTMFYRSQLSPQNNKPLSENGS
jgi:hypothetical protein